MSFRTELYTSFRRVHGPSLALIGTGLAVAAFFFTGDQTVALKWVVLGAVTALLFLFVFADTAYRLHRERTRLPKVKLSRPAPKLHGAAALPLLLLEPSELFGHEAMVSIYSREEEFEVLIGVGFVFHIQMDGHIQVLVNRSADDQAYSETWASISNNDKSVLGRLIVKPSYPKHIEQIWSQP